MTVHLFAAARDLAGAVVHVEARTVGELRAALASQYPALAALLPRCAVAVNLAYAEDAQTLVSTDEVAVLPPVSGGSR